MVVGSSLLENHCCHTVCALQEAAVSNPDTDVGCWQPSRFLGFNTHTPQAWFYSWPGQVYGKCSKNLGPCNVTHLPIPFPLRILLGLGVRLSSLDVQWVFL